MKSKPLNKTGDFIILSGKIDKSYTVLPGVKITFGEGSTFEGIEIASGTTFCNNEYLVKHFTLNSLGQIELTQTSGSSGSFDQDYEAQEPYSHQEIKKSLALIIPSLGRSSASREDSSADLGLPEELMRPRPLAPTSEKDLWASTALPNTPESDILYSLNDPLRPTVPQALKQTQTSSSAALELLATPRNSPEFRTSSEPVLPTSMQGQLDEPAALSGENAEKSSCNGCIEGCILL